MSNSRDFLAALPVSAAALGVDVAIMDGLIRYVGVQYLVAASAGFLAGLVVNYLLSVRFVFRYHRLASRRGEFIAFGLIGLAGLGVNAAVLALLVGQLGLHYLIAKGVAAVTTFLFNFGARRQLLFTPLGKDLLWTSKA